MARFVSRGKIKVLFNDVDISADVADLQVEEVHSPISASGYFSTQIQGPREGFLHITAHITDQVVRASDNYAQEGNVSKNISTKEQVAVRTELADVIKEAVEAKYGKVRTWIETEQTGPLGGISAQVVGAVEHEGKVVPFAINIYSDANVKDRLQEQLEREAEDGELRSQLGWDK